MGRAASSHGDDLDASEVRLISKIEALRASKKLYTIDQVLERNAVLILEASLSLRTPGSKMGLREISSCLKQDIQNIIKNCITRLLSSRKYLLIVHITNLNY